MRDGYTEPAMPAIAKYPVKEHWIDGVRCSSEVEETEMGYTCKVRVMSTGAVLAEAFRSRSTTGKRPVTAACARSSGVKQARERIALERMRGREVAVGQMEARQ